MKKLIFCLFAVVLLAGCTTDTLEDYESYNVDKTEVQRPGSQGIHMEEVDKDKIRRPGSQGDN